MANLPESQTYDAGVYQIETTDPVIGGPDGTSNKPMRNLANRTNWLKKKIEDMPGEAVAIADAKVAAHAAATNPHPQYATDADLAAHASATDPHPQYETSGEAAAKITAHEVATNPHPQYATDADLAAHASATDPHPQYETSGEAAAKITAHEVATNPHPQYATDADLAAHANATDPHTQYATKAAIQAQTYTAFSTAGVAPNFTLTAAPAIEAYAAGLRLHVKFSTAGNGVNTLNVNALGAKSLKQYDATGAKVAAVIAANQLVDVEYDGVDFVLLDPLPTLLYDLSNSFDFSTSISGGTANTLYSPNITKSKGIYLIVPYSLGWSYVNAGGSYYMTTFAEIVSGSGSSTSINLTQDGLPSYDRTPFLLRITSPTATIRFGLKNAGGTPAGQGTLTITTGSNGLGFNAFRIG